MLQTLKTMRRCNTPQFFYFFHKWIQDCTSRHSHRTFYNHDVFFSCIQVGFFIADICIAFFCCNESCRHLYGICSEGKCTRCAFTVMNSSPHRNRNLFSIFFRKCMNDLHDGYDFFFVGSSAFYIVFCPSIYTIRFQLLFMKSKMSPCERSFDHNQIRDSVVFFVPIF